MSDMEALEIKALVPREILSSPRNSMRIWVSRSPGSDDDLAYLRHGDCSFLLQNFYNPEHAGNFMMHLLVADVEAWWRHVEITELVAKYGVRAEPPAERPWGMRDFTITDPSGVLWRIGQNTP